MPSLKRNKTKYPGVFWVDGLRRRAFYIRYKRDGKLIEEKVTAKTAAQANQVRSQRLAGGPSNRERRMIKINTNVWTVDSLCQDYLSSRQNSRCKRDDIGKYNNYIRPLFGDQEPKDITLNEVDRLKKTLLRKLKPQTVTHILGFLRRIVRYGVKKGLCEVMPFEIEMPRFDNKRTEYLSEEQIQRLTKAAYSDHDPHARGIVLMALYTGLRRSAIFRLRWDDLDFKRGMIFLRDPKGGKEGEVNVIPINTVVMELLGNHPKTDSPYVFPGRNGGQRKEVRKSWIRIKNRAKLPEDFRFHGLRHAYASLLASSGKVDIYMLQKLLTHRTPQMTQRYAHLLDDALRQAAETAAEVINKAASSTS